jgi:hypothetical protein
VGQATTRYADTPASIDAAAWVSATATCTER